MKRAKIFAMTSSTSAGDSLLEFKDSINGMMLVSDDAGVLYSLDSIRDGKNTSISRLGVPSYVEFDDSIDFLPQQSKLAVMFDSCFQSSLGLVKELLREPCDEVEHDFHDVLALYERKMIELPNDPAVKMLHDNIAKMHHLFPILAHLGPFSAAQLAKEILENIQLFMSKKRGLEEENVQEWLTLKDTSPKLKTLLGVLFEEKKCESSKYIVYVKAAHIGVAVCNAIKGLYSHTKCRFIGDASADSFREKTLEEFATDNLSILVTTDLSILQ